MHRLPTIGTLSQLSTSPAFRFVFVIGLVNLFADTTYEGGASINGPFMGTVGASAAPVSIVAGLLYDTSILLLVVFSVVTQLASLGVFLMAGRSS
jgi:hypothetical protein